MALEEHERHRDDPGSGKFQYDHAEKRQKIVQACYNRDVDALVQLADSSGGLLEDEIRRSACT